MYIVFHDISKVKSLSLSLAFSLFLSLSLSWTKTQRSPDSDEDTNKPKVCAHACQGTRHGRQATPVTYPVIKRYLSLSTHYSDHIAVPRVSTSKNHMLTVHIKTFGRYKGHTITYQLKILPGNASEYLLLYFEISPAKNLKLNIDWTYYVERLSEPHDIRH